MENYYKIADLLVKMDSFGRTEVQGKPYLTEPGEADVEILSRGEAMHRKYPELSLDDCEYISTGGSFYRQLLRFEGMMLHASAVVVDGKAYLFSADSGTGKSTHTGLWLKCFGEKAYLLNDDKPALRRVDGVWYAYGTPWSGKHDLSRNIRAELGGICCLERGEKNVIGPLAGTEAIFKLLSQTVRPAGQAGPELRGRVLELLDLLIREAPLWKMACNMDPEAAMVAYEAMAGKKGMEIC